MCRTIEIALRYNSSKLSVYSLVEVSIGAVAAKASRKLGIRLSRPGYHKTRTGLWWPGQFVLWGRGGGMVMHIVVLLHLISMAPTNLSDLCSIVVARIGPRCPYSPKVISVAMCCNIPCTSNALPENCSAYYRARLDFVVAIM